MDVDTTLPLLVSGSAAALTLFAGLPWPIALLVFAYCGAVVGCAEIEDRRHEEKRCGSDKQ